MTPAHAAAERIISTAELLRVQYLTLNRSSPSACNHIITQTRTAAVDTLTALRMLEFDGKDRARIKSVMAQLATAFKKLNLYLEGKS